MNPVSSQDPCWQPLWAARDLALQASHFPTQLKLEEYFLGETSGWGLFRDRKGQVKQQFRVLALGSWQGTQFQLHEDFFYSNGDQQSRTWWITPTDEQHYVGTAADIVGQAEGVIAASTCLWRYQLALPFAGKTLQLSFKDYLHLMPNGCLLGHAKVSKFGFVVGEVVLCFQKLPHQLFQAQACTS